VFSISSAAGKVQKQNYIVVYKICPRAELHTNSLAMNLLILHTERRLLIGYTFRILSNAPVVFHGLRVRVDAFGQQRGDKWFYLNNPRINFSMDRCGLLKHSDGVSEKY
jgi:hypothetical protein